jgi:hypothetical protein
VNKDRERGKALELTVGRMLGGRRRRNGEGVGFDDCVQLDGRELEVSIECKAPSALQLRGKWIEQARRNASGRPWLLVQRPLSSRTIYVTCDLSFLVQLLSEAGYVHGTPEDETLDGSSDLPAEPGAASPPGALGPQASL